MHTAEANYLIQSTAKPVRQSVRAALKVLDKPLAEIDRQFGQQVRACPAWREKEDLLGSVPGVDHHPSRLANKTVAAAPAALQARTIPRSLTAG